VVPYLLSITTDSSTAIFKTHNIRVLVDIVDQLAVTQLYIYLVGIYYQSTVHSYFILYLAFLQITCVL